MPSLLLLHCCMLWHWFATPLDDQWSIPKHLYKPGCVDDHICQRSHDTLSLVEDSLYFVVAAIPKLKQSDTMSRKKDKFCRTYLLVIRPYLNRLAAPIPQCSSWIRRYSSIIIRGIGPRVQRAGAMFLSWGYGPWLPEKEVFSGDNLYGFKKKPDRTLRYGGGGGGRKLKYMVGVEPPPYFLNGITLSGTLPEIRTLFVALKLAKMAHSLSQHTRRSTALNGDGQNMVRPLLWGAGAGPQAPLVPTPLDIQPTGVLTVQ